MNCLKKRMETINYICVTQKSTSNNKFCGDHSSWCCQDAGELVRILRKAPNSLCLEWHCYSQATSPGYVVIKHVLCAPRLRAQFPPQGQGRPSFLWGGSYWILQVHLSKTILHSTWDYSSFHRPVLLLPIPSSHSQETAIPCATDVPQRSWRSYSPQTSVLVTYSSVVSLGNRRVTDDQHVVVTGPYLLSSLYAVIVKDWIRFIKYIFIKGIRRSQLTSLTDCNRKSHTPWMRGFNPVTTTLQRLIWKPQK